MASSIPNYELYGETETSHMPDLLHCESIAVRSRVHDGDIRPHRHDGLLQILFARQGHIAATLEGRDMALNGRFMIVVPPLAIHGFDISDDTQGWVLTLPMASLADFLQSAPQLAPFFETPHVFLDATADDNSPDFDDLDGLFDRVDAEFSDARRGRYFALRSALGLLLVTIARAEPVPTNAARNDPRVISGHKARQLARFRERIEQRFRHHDPIDAYAAAIGVTSTHLNRISREITGKSALQVVHERLMIEAKRDLVYSTMTVSEIADVLGFADPAYFTRFFSRHAGQPPAGYRALARRELAEGHPST